MPDEPNFASKPTCKQPHNADIWEDNPMQRATKNRTAAYALGREISGKKALTSPLPLIAPPLNSCFPRRSRLLTVRTGQCSGYVKNSPCPSPKKVNTSQKNWE